MNKRTKKKSRATFLTINPKKIERLRVYIYFFVIFFIIIFFVKI